MSTADYHHGTKYPHIAIMGACPGRQEEREKRPFSGQTGTHLKDMLLILPCKEFRTENLQYLTLMNSHYRPLYKPLSKTTVPKIRDIAKPENINRLRCQLEKSNVSMLLCLGKEAQRASEFLYMQGYLARIKIFRCGHPSPRHLNYHYRGHPTGERLKEMVKKCFSPLIWNDKKRHLERSNH